jgi:orotidine-5'-phosphate decarboxylase
MTSSTLVSLPSPKERLIVALDVDSPETAMSIAGEIGDHVAAFKVGLQLFTAAGPSIVRDLSAKGHRVFLDLKFHDIPNTVAAAAVEAVKLGVWMFNVHALGGREMMLRTIGEVAGFCESRGFERPLVVAVTVLTSTGETTLREVGIEKGIQAEVADLALLTAECGLDGVVASANETSFIRSEPRSKDLLIVTPGIRPDHATIDDQKRVMTPSGALSAGSDYLVVGRPITSAPDRASAVRHIIDEISDAIK